MPDATTEANSAEEATEAKAAETTAAAKSAEEAAASGANKAGSEDAKGVEEGEGEGNKADPVVARREFERRNSRRKIKELEEKIASLEAGDKGEAPPEAPEKPKRPKASDFKYGRVDPKYDEALDEYEEKLDAYNDKKEAFQSAESERKARAEAQSRTAEERRAAAIDDVEKKALDKYSDFEDVVVDVFETMPPAKEAMTSLLGLENAHDVLYHLGSNPDELERITATSPMVQALEFGKLSAKLASKAKDAKATAVTGSKPTPHTPRGQNGQFANESDLRYQRMVEKRQASF